jgi:acylphosphatase
MIMAGGHQAIRVRVTGRVQGVGFRDWTAREARRLGLKGWVRNENDGSVSALVVGAEDAVTTMIERLRKGPRLASVSDVQWEAVTPDTVPPDFTITG